MPIQSYWQIVNMSFKFSNRQKIWIWFIHTKTHFPHSCNKFCCCCGLKRCHFLLRWVNKVRYITPSKRWVYADIDLTALCDTKIVNVFETISLVQYGTVSVYTCHSNSVNNKQPTESEKSKWSNTMVNASRVQGSLNQK